MMKFASMLLHCVFFLLLDTFRKTVIGTSQAVITHMKTLARASLYETSDVVTKGHKVAKRRTLVMMVLDQNRH